MTNTDPRNHVAEPSSQFLPLSHITVADEALLEESLPMTYSTVLIMPPKLLILEG